MFFLLYFTNLEIPLSVYYTCLQYANELVEKIEDIHKINKVKTIVGEEDFENQKTVVHVILETQRVNGQVDALQLLQMAYKKVTEVQKVLRAAKKKKKKQILTKMMRWNLSNKFKEVTPTNTNISLQKEEVSKM